jgi:Fe-S cluster assembly ATP-binding protein
VSLLETKNLKVYAGEKELVKGVSLAIEPGEVHVIMGQNGSGKSTLLNALAGHPKYAVKGSATFEGHDLLALKPHERARAGMLHN